MIPLTCRSHYSLMWGTASIPTLCRRARQLGYPKLALTDTDNLYGMWPFIRECRAQGIEPIIGAEVTDPVLPLRAVCLVKNLEGYQNLTRLLTRRHREHPFSLKQTLPGFARGLVILTQSPELLASWHDLELDLAAALPRHPLSRTHPLCQTAITRGIPLVATPGSFFATPEEARLHALVRAIAKNTCPSRLTPLDLAPDQAYLAGPDIYRQRFHILDQALENSWVLAEKLSFQGPDFGIVMPPFQGKTNSDASILLRKQAFAGALTRYGQSLPGAVISRIDHELAIISQKNFCQYFLLVQDIVKRASRICGRGSGAASIVAYCLGITNVCPIKHNLYFERFLNPGRMDPPDIDVDFAWDERDDILNQVLDQFTGHSAMVASHVLFQPAMAIRETARVFGLPDGEIQKVSRRLTRFWNLAETRDDLLTRTRKKPEISPRAFPQPWPDIIAHAQSLIGIPRYLSVHPGGIVITPEPIDTYVPVETAAKGIPLIQWDKEGAETAGLVKIDLLGNRSLGVIRDCIESIRSATGQFSDFDLHDPEDDPDTQHQVALGNTMGCFYIESPAMRLLQKKSKVGDFDHVVIHSSIIRPAANEWIKAYIQRLHTGVWKPIHPLLGEVLNETLGIMVFQEDVSRVAVHLAGFTHAQADGLRKIMSKKEKVQELADYHALFAAGAAQKGVNTAEIQTIWEMILSFSGYSFCKPHSASYARVSFQAAYLKTHYPAPFMAAVISNQGGFYATFAYVSEARRMGVHILAPDILHSRIPWTGSGHDLRVGLMALKNLSAPCMNRIVAQRQTLPFKSIEDFFHRVRPQPEEALSLVHSGCLDRFRADKTRSALLWAYSSIRYKEGGKKEIKEPTLFAPAHKTIPLPDLPPDPPMEMLRREFSVLGFLCHTHPIVLFAQALEQHKTFKARDLPRHIGKRVLFAGWLITGKTVKTKQGDPMKFLTFEDETGLVETIFFPKAYARFCHMLDYGRPYLLAGRVESDWGAITLTVETSCPISREA